VITDHDTHVGALLSDPQSLFDARKMPSRSPVQKVQPAAAALLSSGNLTSSCNNCGLGIARNAAGGLAASELVSGLQLIRWMLWQMHGFWVTMLGASIDSCKSIASLAPH
jgi:hypothetical protein